MEASLVFNCFLQKKFQSQCWLKDGSHSAGRIMIQAKWNHKYTVRKMDLILRSKERMLQTQLSSAHRFKLQVLGRYNVKFYKMRKFPLETPWLHKLKSTGGRWTNILWISSPGLYHHTTWFTSKILNKYKYFLPYLSDCVIFSAPMNAKWQKIIYLVCCLNILLRACNDFSGYFTLH